MNPYYALSAAFLLGLRGIEKKLKLETPPISHFSPEDRKSGKARIQSLASSFADWA
jgi:glutamine synthetase